MKTCTFLIEHVVVYWLFTINIRRVQGCTIVIKNHGSSLRETSSYWSNVGYTLTTCEATCGSDVHCFAYSFDSDDGKCSKSTETGHKNANNCPTCSFHSKRCGLDCSFTYKSYGNDKTSENPYSVSDKSYPECEASCSADLDCVGFGHDSSSNQCSLSEYNLAEPAEYSCSTCTFSEKVCNGSIAGATTTSDTITEVTTLTSYNLVTTVNDISTTLDIIETTETTPVSNPDSETITSNDDKITVDPKITFTLPESTITTKIIVPPTTTNHKDTTTDMITATPEVTPTYKDTTSNIIAMTTESMPRESTSELTFTTISNETEFPTRSNMTSMANTYGVDTTTLPEMLSSVTVNFTESKNVNGSSMLCLCQCVYDNITSIQGRIEERKNILKVRKDDLSSFQRRLHCAYDPRNSSKIVGGVGILVLTVLLAIVIIPDIFTIAGRLAKERNI